MSIRSKNTVFLSVGAALLSIATAIHADHMVSVVTNDQVSIYVNYALTTGSNYHYGYNFSTTVPGNPSFTDLKTHHVEFSAPAGTGLCWEVETKMNANSGDMDTRIHYYNSSTFTHISLNDDINGSLNRGSLVRVWAYNAFLSIKVLPFSTTYNAKDYNLYITKLPGVTEANCTSSSGKAWVKKINAGAVTYGNNS